MFYCLCSVKIFRVSINRFSRWFPHTVLLLAILCLCSSCFESTPTTPPKKTKRQETKPQPFAEQKRQLLEKQRDFPEKIDPAKNHFAVFIGIDNYPHHQKLAGAVNDAVHMRNLFVERWGCEYATRLDQQATRAGILDAFSRLIKRIQAVREAGNRRLISVVISYSGHGSQIDDEQNGDEIDGKDETLVAYDSDAQGNNDICDDEIDDLIEILSDKLRCQVVLFYDCCHSGTGHRGPGDNTPRQSTRDPLPPPRTKVNPFAAELPANFAPVTLQPGQPRPGYVHYAAAKDHQLAREHRDDSGQICGRFTDLLRKVLPTLYENSTYRDLYEQIAVEFAARFPYQSPQIQGPEAKIDGEKFLGGKAPKTIPAHAKFIWGSDTSTIEMGEVHGISHKSKFAVYKTRDAMNHKQKPHAIATVKELFSFRCIVEAKDEEGNPIAKTDETAVAKPISVGFQNFSVHLSATNFPPELYHPLQQELTNAANAGKFQLAAENESDVVILYQWHENKRTAAMYLHGRLLRRISLHPEDHARSSITSLAPKLVKNLLHLALIQRLMTLGRRHREDGENTRAAWNRHEKIDWNSKLVVELLRSGDQDASYDHDKVQTLLPLDKSQKFTLRLTNNSKVRLFLNIFRLDSEGQLHMLYPPENDEGAPLARDKLWNYKDNAITDYSSGRHCIKVLATEDDLNFRPFIKAPETGLDPNREFLFKASLSLRSTLKNGPLDNALNKEFIDNGQTLVVPAALTTAVITQKSEDEWQIESDKTYILRVGEDALYVYRQRTDRAADMPGRGIHKLLEDVCAGIGKNDKVYRLVRDLEEEQQWFTASVVVEVQ